MPTARDTVKCLPIVHFWRKQAMKNQYDVHATTIGGRPGGDGCHRDRAVLAAPMD